MGSCCLNGLLALGDSFELNPWVPFFSALAGAVAGGLGSLGATYLAGYQRRMERDAEARERLDEQARRELRQAAATVSGLYGVLLEARRFVTGRRSTESVEKLNGLWDQAREPLLLLRVGHPSGELAELARKALMSMENLVSIVEALVDAKREQTIQRAYDASLAAVGELVQSIRDRSSLNGGAD